jgi:hypothetical protein
VLPNVIYEYRTQPHLHNIPSQNAYPKPNYIKRKIRTEGDATNNSNNCLSLQKISTMKKKGWEVVSDKRRLKKCDK